MQIREAVTSDLRHIAPMLIHTQQLHVDAYPERYVPISFEDALLSLEAHIDNEDMFWVAEENGLVIGYIVAQYLESKGHKILRDRRYCYLQQIGVLDSARGKGSGKKLLERLMKECSRQGIDDIELDVWGFNSSAQEFFQTSGFELYSTKLRLSDKSN